MLIATTTHWIPPFGIALYSMELFGLVVADEQDRGLELDGGVEQGKSLCKI